MEDYLFVYSGHSNLAVWYYPQRRLDVLQGLGPARVNDDQTVSEYNPVLVGRTLLRCTVRKYPTIYFIIHVGYG
jgi:hypothetical protein